MVENNKSKFLTIYDYGTGSVLSYIYARSESEIKYSYPELKVLHTEPPWYNAELKETIENKFTFDIDEAPTGFLESLVESRELNKKISRRRNFFRSLKFWKI